MEHGETRSSGGSARSRVGRCKSSSRSLGSELQIGFGGEWVRGGEGSYHLVIGTPLGFQATTEKVVDDEQELNSDGHGDLDMEEGKAAHDPAPRYYEN